MYSNFGHYSYSFVHLRKRNLLDVVIAQTNPILQP